MIILSYFELLQVFTFFEATSPLIKAMFQILSDIMNFILILLFMMFAFANSFYILGKQQAITSGSSPDYASFIGAFEHVFYISMGEFNTDEYEDSDQSYLLFALFYSACFLFIVHMLNMLIAMMGET
jgi:hypothetical protein